MNWIKLDCMLWRDRQSEIQAGRAKLQTKSSLVFGLNELVIFECRVL